jgi:hypothetical protein
MAGKCSVSALPQATSFNSAKISSALRLLLGSARLPESIVEVNLAIKSLTGHVLSGIMDSFSQPRSAGGGELKIEDCKLGI